MNSYSRPSMASKSTFGEHLARTDAERFVGRAAEVARLEDLLSDEPERRVVWLYGPGGIGKSTLLRELARRAAERNLDVVSLDARDMDPVPNELEEALEPAFASTRPLLLLDTWERMAAAGTALRHRLLPALPASAVVVIASREAPGADWFSGGWESLVAELELRPLPRDDATELVRSIGLDETETRDIVNWAGGSPLALTVAAGAARDHRGWHPDRPEDDPDVLRSLLRRVIENELEPADADAAAAAALTRRATPDLLTAVLPGVDGRAAVARLLELSFAEKAGTGVRFHDLARRALRAEIRQRDPAREADLRRRIADHFHARILAGEPRLVVDLAELVDNPAVRWGFGAEGSPELRIDAVRPGFPEELAPILEKRGDGPIVPSTVELIKNAPERVIVARDGDDRLCGYAISVTPASATPPVEADPVLGPWLAHARASDEPERALLWSDSVDLTSGPGGDPGSPVLALMNTAVLLRSGITNPRYLYLPINPVNGPAVAFAQSVGAKHVAELDVRFGTMEVQCNIMDTGPAGLVGAAVAILYSELGIEPPPPPEPWVAPADRGADAESVRNAFKSFHRPSELAANP